MLSEQEPQQQSSSDEFSFPEGRSSDVKRRTAVYIQSNSVIEEREESEQENSGEESDTEQKPEQAVNQQESE